MDGQGRNVVIRAGHLGHAWRPDMPGGRTCLAAGHAWRPDMPGGMSLRLPCVTMLVLLPAAARLLFRRLIDLDRGNAAAVISCADVFIYGPLVISKERTFGVSRDRETPTTATEKPLLRCERDPIYDRVGA